MTSYVQHLSGFKLLPFIFFPLGGTKVGIFAVKCRDLGELIIHSASARRDWFYADNW